MLTLSKLTQTHLKWVTQRQAPLFPYLTLLLWVLPLVFMQSTGQSLMAHDEGLYAIHAKSILETGDWLSPQWGEQIYFDRTIGIQWLIAICYIFFGISDDVARLPSQIAFVGSVLLLYRMGYLIFQQRQLAWLAAAILAITPLAVQYSRLGTQDAVLVAIELLAAWAMLESERQQAQNQNQRRSLLLLTGAAFGWGFMIKGFMIIPAAIALLPYLLLQFRQQHHLRNPWLYIGLVLGGLPGVGWLWAATQKYDMQPLNELVGKLFALSQSDYYNANPLYYLWNIPANGFPWVFFAIAGMLLCLKNRRYHDLIKRHWALVWGFPLALFVELMLFKTRTHYYPLQLFPWLSLFAAVAVNFLVQQYRQPRSRHWLHLVSFTLGGLGLLLTWVSLLGLTHHLPGGIELESGDLGAIASVCLVLGLGWSGLLLIWLSRDQITIWRSAKLWLVALFMPVWLALAMLGLTGLWGNYSAALKETITSPTVAAIIQQQPIDFIANQSAIDSRARKNYLLLSFYTRINGRHYRQWEPVDLAWVDPTLAKARSADYAVLAEYQGWELVQRRSREAAVKVN
jgi:4-amino-4-deoxy-L-arabinose transferase-like glycosyltransferase